MDEPELSQTHEFQDFVRSLEFVDEFIGLGLPSELAKAAGKEELQYLFERWNVYEVIKVDGKLLVIPIRWIDINKGDNKSPQISSRWVLCKTAKRSQLDAIAQTYCSILPLEAFRFVLSQCMTCS